MRAIGITIALLAVPSAWANDCAEPYTVDQLLSDLTVVENALRESEDSAAAEAARGMARGLGCLDEVLPALIAARAYRAVGAGIFVEGATEEADKWLRTALEVDPTWTYGLQDIGENHPLRPHFEELKEEPVSEPVPLEGSSFVEGTFYLNGRKITKPRARLERFHVFQAEGPPFSSAVIEGNGFPAAFVSVEGEGGNGKKKDRKSKKPEKPKDVAKSKRPKTKKPKTRTVVIDGKEVTVNVRERPPEKIPLLIGGSAIIVGSGVLYALANQKAAALRTIKSVLSEGHMLELNGGLPPPEDGDYTGRFCAVGQRPDTDGCFVRPQAEALRLRKQANQLVLASLSLLAVGVGTTTWGVLVDDGGFMPTVRVRF